MKKIIFAFLALIIASCGGSKEVIANLDGEYQLRLLDEEDVSAEDLSFTFNPSEKRISGETTCNGFSAQYTQENNVLSIGRAMSTRMYCEGRMEMEQKIISSLEDVARVEKNGKDLVFFSTDNRRLFTLTQK